MININLTTSTDDVKRFEIIVSITYIINCNVNLEGVQTGEMSIMITTNILQHTTDRIQIKNLIPGKDHDTPIEK